MRKLFLVMCGVVAVGLGVKGVIDSVFGNNSGSSSIIRRCPECGKPMTKEGDTTWHCEKCDIYDFNDDYYEDYDDEDGESINVNYAADIWRSSGEDEDYMFGYSEDELRNA